jgi:hypothetical protein
MEIKKEKKMIRKKLEDNDPFFSFYFSSLFSIFQIPK